jgi:putative ABC transport system permease protein
MEHLREIFNSIKHNQIRTILSGFGISWGIYILVLLLGTGTGFQNAVMSMFSVFAQKSIYVYGGITSAKHDNSSEGKLIRFDNRYIESIENRFNEIDAISAEVSGYYHITRSQKSGNFRIIGVSDDFMRIKILSVKDGGRNINPSDVERDRNVAIVGENVVNSLALGGGSLLNKCVNINGVSFKIIGVLSNEDIFSASEINSIYIPITSYFKELNSNIEFSSFCLSLNSDTDSKHFEQKLKSYISAKSGFAFDDKQALYITNFETQTSSFESLFNGLKMFIWAIGICFLISGVVGISNIMFVSVKERTSEIGIRLAVGASPRSIMNLILLESIIITSIAGSLGLMFGKLSLLLIDWLLSMSSDDVLLEKTMLELPVAVMALIVLVISGIIAGLIPAINAARIEPVDAIRYENRN